MKKNDRSLLTTLFIFIVSSGFAQQNVQFSQYIFNELAVNPAYAGYKEEWTAHLLYRSQWVSITGAPKTATFSFDGLTDSYRKNTGLGLQITNDKLGAQSNLSAYTNYSYRLKLDALDTRRLCLGLGVGVSQYALNGDELSYVQENDSRIQAGTVNTITPDLRFGVYYYSPTFFAGASVMDLFADYISTKLQDGTKTYLNIKKTRHYYFSAGGLITLSSTIILKPSFLIKEDFKGPTNLDLNTFFAFNEKVWIGASWRTGIKLWSKDNLISNLQMADAYSVMAQFYVNDRFRIGYAYDRTLSELSNYENGSHEVSVSLSLPSHKLGERILSPRYF
ncbi:hypothetical protein D3C80_277530 [compost metagenome]